MKQKNVFMNQIKPFSKRMDIKRLIKKSQECKKEQLEILNKLLQPLRDNIELGKQTLKGEYPINYYLIKCDQVRKYLQRLEPRERID